MIRTYRMPRSAHEVRSTSSEKKRKLRMLKKVRAVFRKTPSQQSRQFIIRLGRKKVFFRVGDTTKTPAVFAGHLVMRACYPKNSVPIIGLFRAVVPYAGKQEYKLLGIASEIVRNRAPEYKEHQTGYYRQERDPNQQLTPAHRRKVDAEIRPFIREIEERTGIVPNAHSTNIGISNGRPIFFEIFGVNIPVFRRYARENGITAQSLLASTRIPNSEDRENVRRILREVLETSTEGNYTFEQQPN